MLTMPNIEIENAELIMPFRNFSGKPSKFNPNGDRSFAVYIPDDMAQTLEADGWNVKMTKERDGYPARPYISVAVKYNFRPPIIKVGSNKNKMADIYEDTVGELDFADIVSIDLVIRPRVYDVNGKQGVKAYLAEAYVIIQRSSLAEKYQGSDEEF